MKRTHKKRLNLPNRTCQNRFCKKSFKPSQHRSKYCSLACNRYTYARELKKVVFTMIDPKCQCKGCGFKNLDGLAISHVNNDGHLDRLHNKVGSGYPLYVKIRDGRRSLKGLEILCANCNNIVQARYRFVDPTEVIKALRLENNLDKEIAV